jgi:hypothetical protein
VFGYPGAADSSGVTLTDGIVSAEVRDDRLSSNRGMLNITAAINPGNSGGLTVNEQGELVGVPTGTRPGRDANVSSMRPADLAVGLIEAARNGEDYESPYYRDVSDESVTNARLVQPDTGVGIRFECDNAPLDGERNDGFGVSFEYSGFPADEHQDLGVFVWAGDSLVGWFDLSQDYDVEWPTEAGCATVTIPVEPEMFVAPGDRIEIGVGPNHEVD